MTFALRAFSICNKKNEYQHLRLTKEITQERIIIIDILIELLRNSLFSYQYYYCC